MPILDSEKGFSYEWAINSTGIRLQIVSIDATIEDDYAFVDTAVLFEREIAPARYLTVSEYAKLYGVESVTVRQWIRRGKLFNVKKVAGEWLISEFALYEPGRRYRPRKYHLGNTFGAIPEEYGFIKQYRSLSIRQSAEDRKVFIINLYKNENCEDEYVEEIDDYLDLSDHIEMDIKSRERFEGFLLRYSDTVEQEYSFSI